MPAPHDLAATPAEQRFVGLLLAHALHSMEAFAYWLHLKTCQADSGALHWLSTGSHHPIADYLLDALYLAGCTWPSDIQITDAGTQLAISSTPCAAIHYLTAAWVPPFCRLLAATTQSLTPCTVLGLLLAFTPKPRITR